MTTESLTEIIRVVIDEHAEDVGRWIGEAQGDSPLSIALLKYHAAQFWLIRDLRMWIENGTIPERLGD